MSKRYTDKGWIDIGSDLTKEAFRDFKKGQVLSFDYEGTRRDFKIMRISKTKCWIKETKLYTADEMNEMPREDAEYIIKNGS